MKTKVSKTKLQNMTVIDFQVSNHHLKVHFSQLQVSSQKSLIATLMLELISW